MIKTNNFQFHVPLLFNDARSDENHQLLLVLPYLREFLNKLPSRGMLAQERHAVVAVDLVDLVEAADDDGAAVIDHDRGLGRLGDDGRHALTCLSKLAMSFLMSICMITEPRAVICGVTFSSRAALMYWVVMVLFWLVWMGMRSPWVISAGMLFWVVARGEEMMRALPL